MKLFYTSKDLKPRIHREDAGIDLRAADDVWLEPMDIVLIPTGVSLEIPTGVWGFITGRSSMNVRGLIVHQGVVDSGYRGEVKVVLQNLSGQPQTIKKGDRVAQLLLLQHLDHSMVQLVKGKAEVTTERGIRGFGSTGEK